MWDCKYRNMDDFCRRRNALCCPAGKGCVLEGKYICPFRDEADPLIEFKKIQRRYWAAKHRPLKAGVAEKFCQQ